MPTSGVRGKTYVRLASQKGGVAAHLAPKGVLPQAAPRERAGRQKSSKNIEKQRDAALARGKRPRCDTRFQTEKGQEQRKIMKNLKIL